MDSILQQAIDLEKITNKIHNITLTEVIGMKIYCDAYIKLKGREYFKTHPLKTETPEKYTFLI